MGTERVAGALIHSDAPRPVRSGVSANAAHRDRPRGAVPRPDGTSISGSDPAGRRGVGGPGDGNGHHEEVAMAKKARKKKARKKSAANHGKRPNS